MAFTLQSYVADPTATVVAAYLQAYVADPTAVVAGAHYPAFVVDPTLAIQGKLPAFIADPTAAVAGAHYPAFIADPTAVVAGAHYPAFVVDPTLAIQGKLPAFIADPTATVIAAHYPAFIAAPTATVIAAHYPAFIAAPAMGLPGLYGVMQFTQSMSGVTGDIGGIAVTMPMFTMSGDAESRFPNRLELFQQVMTGHTGVVGAIAVTLPDFQVSLVSWPVGQLAVATQLFSSKLTGATGQIGNITGVMPPLTVSMTGYVQSSGSINVSMQPFFTALSSIAGAGSSYVTVAMHTEWQALTTYTNYPFNSFAQFNDVFMGASGTGLYALTGDKDDGTNIDAVVRTGVTDMGTSHLKKNEYVYVGYRASGDLLLRVNTNDAHTRDYRVAYNGETGLHVKRVKLGKGVIARYWQLEVQNIDGADFDLNTLEIKPTVIGRRVSSGRA